MGTPLRAAVVGASGFGRYHAQWYAREGAEVVGYVCTTEVSVANTESSIFELSHQKPRGYTDIGRMLDAERPDVVSICTPPDCHLVPTEKALKAGSHVLCEKPMAFESGRSNREILEMADRMIDAAENAGRVLAVNLQYAAALEPYLRIYKRDRGVLDTPKYYEFTMESKGNRKGSIQGESIWIDLGPHTITPLMNLYPDLTPDLSSIRVSASDAEIAVEIDFVVADGRRINARLKTGACPNDMTPKRRFGFDGYVVDIVSRRGDDGVLMTGLMPPDGNAEEIVDDLMHTGIRRFLGAAQGNCEPLVTCRTAFRNQDIVLEILTKIRACL